MKKLIKPALALAALLGAGAALAAGGDLGQAEKQDTNLTAIAMFAIFDDMIVSSGAVSAGSFDFIKDGLVASGADILYHKLKLKPGKPNLLAILPSGEIYFGLPGNPVATAVGLRFFVAAALRVMQSQKPEVPIYARAINEFSKKSGLHMVLKGRLGYQDDGSMTVNILDGQESFKVNPFLNMNCWIHVSEEREHISAGEVLEVYHLGI